MATRRKDTPEQVVRKLAAADREPPPRLLPILLPSRWTALAPSGQLWNVGPAHELQWTVLDDAPIPTDQKAGGSSPSERATSDWFESLP